MPTLADIGLVPASVARTASFGEAVEKLDEHGVAMIAIVDERQAVVGMFGAEEVLRGLFPRYLGELRHTAFAKDDIAGLLERTRTVGGEPVERHMCEAVTVEADTSAIHVAERFLHCRLPTLAAVANGTFVGVLDRATFARAMVDVAGGFEVSRPSRD